MNEEAARWLFLRFSPTKTGQICGYLGSGDRPQGGGFRPYVGG